MATTKRDQILSLFQQTRVLRPQDVEAVGISRTYLNKLHAEVVLDRPTRGLYVLQNDDPSEQRSLVEACRLVPRGIICLLSALQFHGLKIVSSIATKSASTSRSKPCAIASSDAKRLSTNSGRPPKSAG